MTTTAVLPNAPDLNADDYVVLGVATCFLKDDGDFHPVKVVEPIPSAALEALFKGITTSYELAYAARLGDVLAEGTITLPTDFPAETQLCDDFAERIAAASRTYRLRTDAASHIAPGETYRDFNYNLDRKRVLNSERIVKTEDNVKQHEYTHRVL